MNTLLEFGRRLLRECEGDDVSRFDAGLLEDLGNTLGDDLRLARAGTRNDLQWLIKAPDGFRLSARVGSYFAAFAAFATRCATADSFAA